MVTLFVSVVLLIAVLAASGLSWLIWQDFRSHPSSAGRLLDDEYWGARRAMNDAANQSWRNLTD
ncbi:MAG: hypothetical protein NTX33_00085 [Propionibacteriales bacterium]|nr:hypothetical protein [Propionibacteriales bacterium]